MPQGLHCVTHVYLALVVSKDISRQHQALKSPQGCRHHSVPSSWKLAELGTAGPQRVPATKAHPPANLVLSQAESPQPRCSSAQGARRGENSVGSRVTPKIGPTEPVPIGFWQGPPELPQVPLPVPGPSPSGRLNPTGCGRSASAGPAPTGSALCRRHGTGPRNSTAFVPCR